MSHAYHAALVRYARPVHAHRLLRDTGYDDAMRWLLHTLPPGHPVADAVEPALTRLHQPSLERVQAWATGLGSDLATPEAEELLRGRYAVPGPQVREAADPYHLWALQDVADAVRTMKLRHGLPLDETGYDAERPRDRYPDEPPPEHPVSFAREEPTVGGAGTGPVRYALFSEQPHNPDEVGFHGAMHSNPDDHLNPLVYADWLEEHDKPTVAELVRLHCQDNAYGVHDTPLAFTDSFMRPGDWKATMIGNAQDPGFHVVLATRSQADQSRKLSWLASFADPRDAHRVAAGLTADGVKGNQHLAAPRIAGPAEPERYAAWRAPAGGMVVRGQFFQGGKMLPDLQGDFANPPPQRPSPAPSLKRTKRERLVAAIKRRKAAYPEALAAAKINRMSDTPRKYSAADHQSFASAIAANRADDLPALVYADWLDEHNYPGAAELIRRNKASARPQDTYYSTPRRAYQAAAEAAGPRTYVAHWAMRRGAETNPIEHVLELNYRLPDDPHTYLTHSVVTTPEDAHRLVAGMGDLPGADIARDELETRYPHLRATE